VARSNEFPGACADVAFTPDGTLVAATDWRGNLRRFDAATLQKRTECKAPGYVGRQLSISADGKSLATADRRIMVWDFPSGKPHHCWETHGDTVRSVAFSPTGKTLVSAGVGGIYCWDAATGRMLRRFPGSEELTSDAVLSHDGRTIISVVSGTEIRAWDVATGQATNAAKGAAPFSSDAMDVWSIDIHAGDKQLALGLRDGTVRLWDMMRQNEVDFIPQPAIVTRVRFSPDGKLLAVGALEKGVRLYEVESAKKRHENRVKSGVLAEPDDDSVIGLAELGAIPDSDLCFLSRCDFVPGSTLIAVARFDRLADNRQLFPANDHVRLWDYVHAKAKWESPLLEWPETICASPDGRLVAAVIRGARVRIMIWSVASGKLLKELRANDNGIPALAFSPDSTRLASAGADATLLIWDISRARE